MMMMVEGEESGRQPEEIQNVIFRFLLFWRKRRPRRKTATALIIYTILSIYTSIQSIHLYICFPATFITSTTLLFGVHTHTTAAAHITICT